MCIVYEWSEHDVESLFEDKTVTMLMKVSLAASRRLCLGMNGKLISYAEFAKYLRVNLSERTNFKVHTAWDRDNECSGQMRNILY